MTRFSSVLTQTLCRPLVFGALAFAVAAPAMHLLVAARIAGSEAPDANAMLVSKEKAELAMDAAACIGCGACVAACKNSSAMLFVAAKVSQLGLLPQGQPERDKRVLAMVQTMDEAGFGNCTNYGECQAHCPKSITLDVIAKLNRDYLRARVKEFFSSTGKPSKGGD